MKKITISEVKTLARANYNNGGDSIIECYEDWEIQEEINNGMDTAEKWLRRFEVVDDYCKDIEGTADNFPEEESIDCECPFEEDYEQEMRYAKLMCEWFNE